MKTLIGIALLALALCGCSARQEREQREAAALAKMNAEDDAYCQSYGVAKGSPDYVSCRNNLTQVRANAATVAAVNNNAAARQLTASGINMMNCGMGHC
jgi:hypothetical protein